MAAQFYISVEFRDKLSYIYIYKCIQNSARPAGRILSSFVSPTYIPPKAVEKERKENRMKLSTHFLLFVSRLLFFVLCFWFYYMYPFFVGLICFVLLCFVAAAFSEFQCLNAFSGRDNKTERTSQILLICITHPMQSHANKLCKLSKSFCESHFKHQKSVWQACMLSTAKTAVWLRPLCVFHFDFMLHSFMLGA